MKSIPVDQTRLTLQGIASAPKQRDGVQSTNTEGMPLWTVQALVQSTDANGKAQLVDVTIPGTTSPSFQPLSELDFNQLTARSWEMNGRSGVSFSATGVRVLSAKASA